MRYPDHQQDNLIDTQIIVVFCFCDDMLEAIHHDEDSQCQMSDAQVLTTADRFLLIAYFQASISKIVETTGSLTERLLPNFIPAVTAKGFEIKVALLAFACNINFLW